MINSILKFLRRKVISVWYMNYLTAGWQMIGLFTNYAIFLTFITVFMGKSNPYYWYVVIGSIITSTILLTLLGYFMFSKRGVRFHSSLKAWKSDPHSELYSAMYEQIADMSKKMDVPLGENFKTAKEFLEVYSKEQDGFRLIKEDIAEHKNNSKGVN